MIQQDNNPVSRVKVFEVPEASNGLQNDITGGAGETGDILK
jgi:hypothetical protein